MKRYGYVHWIFWMGLLGLVLAAGCTVKTTGPAHPNTPPKVFFSTVPVAGTVFTKPDQFFWFALDRDGYIVEFQYALVADSVVKITKNPPQKEDSVVRAFLAAHPVDSDTLWHWKVVDNIRHNGQTDTIALPTSSKFASDTATRNTVVFVRARDDRGALSSSSPNFPDSNSIAWRYFGRKNRPPDTHFADIGVCNKSLVAVAGQIPTFYSLDRNTYDTSAFLKVGHCGITINWFGSDSADYPNQEQPPFDYFWELFGPFPNRFVTGPDTTKLWASTTYPIRWPGPNAAPYQSPNKQSFTKVMSVTFFGLRGVDTLTNFRPGYYYFRVRARDDAGVLDPVADKSSNTFKVFHPRFDRDILLVGKSTTMGGGPFLNLVPPYGYIPDGSTPPQDSAQVQSYYLKLVRDAGYGAHIDSAQDVKFYSEKSDPGFNSGVPGIPMTLDDSVLARYKLVIFHKEGVFPTQNTNLTAMLKAYMDVGGSVWGMGREDLTDLLSNVAGVDRPQEVFYDRSSAINGVGYFYFGAEKMFFNAHARLVAAESTSREEFVGADLGRYGLTDGFPPLDIDTNVVLRYTVAAARKDTSRYRQMPGVNYFVRQTRSEELYLYRSPVGVADTSHLNGKVVALRTNRTFFKTAYFGFPLYGIQEPQAVVVMQKMLNWFLGPP